VDAQHDVSFLISIYQDIAAMIKRSRLISWPMPVRYLAQRDYELGS